MRWCLSLLVLVAACGVPVMGDPCMLGEAELCLCATGSVGVRTCTQAGRFGRCFCEMGDGGASTDSSPDGTSDAALVMSDASPDAGASDAAVLPEAAGPDSARPEPPPDTGSSCDLLACADTDPCSDDLCEGGRCVHRPNTGARCSAGSLSGTCMRGMCCTGCLDTSGACGAGTSAAQCGSGGQACMACADDGNPCTAPAQCTGGRCMSSNLPDGTACPGGTCAAGRCNTCGAPGQVCCPGTPRTCNAGAVCNSGLRCEACGARNQLCCGGTTCNDVGDACSSGSCAPCGGFGQVCCARFSCRGEYGSTCRGTVCSCGGRCEYACTSGAPYLCAPGYSYNPTTRRCNPPSPDFCS